MTDEDTYPSLRIAQSDIATARAVLDAHEAGVRADQTARIVAWLRGWDGRFGARALADLIAREFGGIDKEGRDDE